MGSTRLRSTVLLVVLGFLASSCIWSAGHFTFTVESHTYRTVHYVDGSTADLGVDVYLPDTAPGWARPTFIIWHAGGFVYNDQTHPGLVVLAEDLVSRGFVVIAPAHRLSPAGGPAPVLENPEQVPPGGYWHGDNAEPFQLGGHGLLGMFAAYEDSLALLDWLHPRVAQYNIDAERIVVGGGSSGAMNAINVQMFAPSEANPPALYPAATVLMFGGFIPGRAADWVNSGSGALWMFNGAEDQLVWPEHAEDLEAAWSAVGLPHRIHIIPGLAHVGVDMLDPNLGPEPGLSWFDDMADFLYEELYG